MPRALRRLCPEEVYFVTNRTIEQRFLFKPGRVSNEIMARCLAKTAEQYGIVLYAYVFMINHFHLVLRAPRGNLSAFMACFQSMLAKEVNRHLGRSGPVFHRRFSSAAILDEGALIERIVYTLNNPVKEPIVRHIKHYQGLHSYHDTFHGQRRRLSWLDRRRWWQAGRPKDKKPFQTTVTLGVTPLPPEWLELLRRELEADTKKWAAEHKAAGKTLMSPKSLRKLKVTDRPKQPARPSAQPRCHTRHPELYQAFAEVWHRFHQAYREAAQCLANGQWPKACFPYGSFPPTRYRVRFEPEPGPLAVLCF